MHWETKENSWLLYCGGLEKPHSISNVYLGFDCPDSQGPGIFGLCLFYI